MNLHLGKNLPKAGSSCIMLRNHDLGPQWRCGLWMRLRQLAELCQCTSGVLCNVAEFKFAKFKAEADFASDWSRLEVAG
jgi:hypothetical protein